MTTAEMVVQIVGWGMVAAAFGAFVVVIWREMKNHRRPKETLYRWDDEKRDYVPVDGDD